MTHDAHAVSMPPRAVGKFWRNPEHLLSYSFCKDALNQNSKNRRRNPSILIRHNGSNILIDCGKTFRESMIRTAMRLLTIHGFTGEITEHKITRIDALIITHPHADALNGLDDLREFRSMDGDVVPMPLYIRKPDLDHVAKAFPYIIDPSRATGSGFVSKIEPHVINERDPFEFIPILLDHGPNSTCLGFRFGDVAYLSDLVHLCDESRHKLLSFGAIDLLIIDALFVERPNGSHFSLPESLAEIRRLRPRQAMLVGMSHDFEYHTMNQKLKAMKETDNIHVECAYDGLIMEIPSLMKLLPGTPKATAHDSS